MTTTVILLKADLFLDTQEVSLTRILNRYKLNTKSVQRLIGMSAAFSIAVFFSQIVIILLLIYVYQKQEQIILTQFSQAQYPVGSYRICNVSDGLLKRSMNVIRSVLEFVNHSQMSKNTLKYVRGSNVVILLRLYMKFKEIFS